MAAYRFQFRPVLTIVGALAFALLVALGVWQLRRLEWKEALIAQVEARVSAAPIPFEEAVRRADAGEVMEYTPVMLSGRFDYDEPADIFGAYKGVPGVYRFTPLSVRSGTHVYVNRGFTPQNMRKQEVLNANPLERPIAEVSGLLRYAEKPRPPASWVLSQGKSVDGLWSVRDPGAFAQEAGINASAYYVDQFAVKGRDWPQGGTTRLEFNNRHLEYALTWFGLAAALAGVWLAFSVQKRSAP